MGRSLRHLRSLLEHLSKVDDHIRYGVIDVGYDVWRDERFRAAPFVGYSILHQYMQGFGCTQIANPNSDCGTPIPTKRIRHRRGRYLACDAARRRRRLADRARLKLTADAAYLPYVHSAAPTITSCGPALAQWANGTGAQLEFMLAYAVTDS